MSTYRNLMIWQKSMNLTTQIYLLTNTFPKEEIYGLTSQIRRCSISIPSNIAEGYGTESDKDFLRFLYISVGSLFEMQTQLEIAKNIAYINEDLFNNIYENSREVERMIVSFNKKIKERNSPS
ncbi:four helix bundle protein [Flavobacterium faecale]|uniref:four helix bundle protein n=1 Tax=Flavobacterium faecale TaxID=1355330 RepID=UPI003AAF8F46